MMTFDLIGTAVAALAVVATATFVAARHVMFRRNETQSQGSRMWVVCCPETNRIAIVDVLECAGSKVVIDCSSWCAKRNCYRSCESHLVVGRPTRLVAR